MAALLDTIHLSGRGWGYGKRAKPGAKVVPACSVQSDNEGCLPIYMQHWGSDWPPSAAMLRAWVHLHTEVLPS